MLSDPYLDINGGLSEINLEPSLPVDALEDAQPPYSTSYTCKTTATPPAIHNRAVPCRILIAKGSIPLELLSRSIQRLGDLAGQR